MHRLADQRGDRVLLDDPAGVHDGDAVGDLDRGAEVVADEDHRHAGLALQLAQKQQDLGLHRRIDGSRRLVGEQQARPARERQRDPRALALACRARIDGVVVAFPRVLGIEAVGTVAGAPGGELRIGQPAATVMGGMGRQFDGGYAEYTVVPATQVRAINTSLGWDRLGSLPEMLQTTWGTLFRALRLKRGDRLLIRGGTTSVGPAAAALAKAHGAEVGATSRRAGGEVLVRRAGAGADRFFLDDGAIAETVREQWDGGADKVLELIGTTTLRDSLRSTRQPGTVCMTGVVGDRWSLPDFAPMDVLPTAMSLTTYTRGRE